MVCDYNLAIIGIDYTIASIDIREKVSLLKSQIQKKLADIKSTYADGVVILSTCNRTEIYLASDEIISDCTLVTILESCSNLQRGSLENCHYIKRDEKLIKYLFELTCGLHSMILGEDQIITQVGEAMTISSELKCGNALLNTLFRHAITCAKKAKSVVNIQFISPSIVSNAVKICSEKINLSYNTKVLVIGNGEMGRLAVKCMAKYGCDIVMTVRTYHSGTTIIPNGCTTIGYDKRTEYLEWADVVLSATKSPHFTITCDALKNANKLPQYIFDLALPRDIEVGDFSNKNVKIYDVDKISNGNSCYDEEAVAQIKQIISEQLLKFGDWLTHYELSKRSFCNV